MTRRGHRSTAAPFRRRRPTDRQQHLIKVLGHGGDDTITLDETNGAMPAAQLLGGSGNDTLTGGSGDDQLFGGAGTT